jgi:hypothetical protein
MIKWEEAMSNRYAQCEAEWNEINEWLALYKEVGSKIDPETAEVSCRYTNLEDPYGLWPDLVENGDCVERVAFARLLETDIWVMFDHLPETTYARLDERFRERLAQLPDLGELELYQSASANLV